MHHRARDERVPNVLIRDARVNEDGAGSRAPRLRETYAPAYFLSSARVRRLDESGFGAAGIVAFPREEESDRAVSLNYRCGIFLTVLSRDASVDRYSRTYLAIH